MAVTPVYLITGFLDSGKTTFLRDTLQDSEFLDGEKTVLILCEEGEEEYDMDILKEKNVTVLTVENEEDLNPRFLMDIKKNYKPEKVMIEFNGTWSTSKLLENGFCTDGEFRAKFDLWGSLMLRYNYAPCSIFLVGTGVDCP